MKLERLFDGRDSLHTYYPYKYRIELSPELTVYGDDRVEMISWIRRVKFKCCLVETAIYVRDDQDASLFMLKWASCQQICTCLVAYRRALGVGKTLFVNTTKSGT